MPEQKMSDKDYISITPKQIRSVLPHTDANKIDRSTGDRLIIARVRVPSAKFRSYRFGQDGNGIDLDDRAAFLNLPASMLYLNLTHKDGSKLDSRSEQYNVMLGNNGKLLDRKTGADVSDKYTVKGLYAYIDPDRKLRVHFASQYLGESQVDGVTKMKYDKPEAKDVPGSVICEMYREAVMKSKELQQLKAQKALEQDNAEQSKEKTVKSPTNTLKSKEVQKNSNLNSKTKTKNKPSKTAVKKKATKKKSEPER